MKWLKIVNGAVIQTYEDEVCIGQEFLAGDVDYENCESGQPINRPCEEQYQPFDMVQPDLPDATL